MVITLAQLEPSAKAPWTKTMFFTGCVGAALTGPAATESAMAAAAVMPSSVVVLIVCSFGVVEKSGNKWAQGRRQFTHRTTIGACKRPSSRSRADRLYGRRPSMLSRFSRAPSKSVACLTCSESRIGSFPIHPFGQVFDCSGRSPAIRINAMSNIPAQPPPTNATNSHQTEVTADSLLNELSVADIRFDRMRYIGHVHITPEVRS